MGKILCANIWEAHPRDINSTDKEVLQMYARSADDNTKMNVSISDDLIGYHAYPSKLEIGRITNLSANTVGRSVERLKETHWLEEYENHKSSLGRKCHKVNISKMVRCLILEETIKKHSLKRGETKTTKKQTEKVDERRVLLEESAYAFYPDDFTHSPIKSMYWNLEIPYIEELDALLEGGEKALENYWRVTMKKKFGATTHNIENQETEKSEKTEEDTSPIFQLQITTCLQISLLLNSSL